MRRAPAHSIKVAVSAAVIVLGGLGAFFITDAFTGPTSGGGVGSGAIGTDNSNNVSVGTSTPQSSTKFLIVTPNSATSSYALRILQPNSTSIFSIDNSGTVTIPGALNAGSQTGTVSSGNVSAGQFGLNTGGGNYYFP